jgi:hypothetical protein
MLTFLFELEQSQKHVDQGYQIKVTSSKRGVVDSTWSIEVW